MASQDPHPNVQAARRVYENGITANSSSAPAETIYIVRHPDAPSGTDILLWDDILSVFSTALYVRSGAVALPFLKGPNFKNLEPRRIAAKPEITLDIVIKGSPDEKEQSVESLQKALPTESEVSSSIYATVKRNPVGGPVEAAWENYMHMDDETPPTATNNAHLADRRGPVSDRVEEAMDAYRNNKNPAFGPHPRGPQGLVGETSSSPTSDTPPTPQTSVSSSETLSTQGSVSDNNSNNFHETMQKAKLGDEDAQFDLGDMYNHAKGVQQDYQAAMDWYVKAANQGHPRAQNAIGSLHQYGQGVPQNFATAMDWYRKAADQENPIAQYNIGYMYKNGLGVSQDFSAAFS
ncbi:hypothetical protein BGZ91_000658 [Linnemannia elongata]|nr:hypothetical protein BGZ91_000658 [Linnemannia elongata]